MIYHNITKRTITLQLEPWGELYLVEPNIAVSIDFENELFFSEIEFLQDEDYFTIYGNFNNRITVLLNGEESTPFFL
jgi:hypothetical protein